MKKIILPAAFLAVALSMRAQYSGPRLFLDLPVIYAAAPDMEHIGNRLGAGLETAMNVATHWSTARIGGGATFTLDPKSEDVGDSFLTTPFARLEAGAGMYRSNGNKCAKTKQSAFTAMGKAGMVYNFQKIVGVEDQLDFTVGAEFGLFFIRDVFRNWEVVLSGNYHTKAEVISANFGFKMFLNLRADRD